MQSPTQQPKHVSLIGGPIVQTERVRLSVGAQCGNKEGEHVLLALGRHNAERDDVACVVVHERVHTHGDPPVADDECRAVTDVSVPEGVWAHGLPAQTGLRALLLLVGSQSGEPFLPEDPADRRGAHLIGIEPAVGGERGPDQRNGRRRELASNVE